MVAFNFGLSVAVLTAVYLAVAALERVPALAFRTLPRPRPYLATDAAWYGVAVGATAVSAFVIRPQLARMAIGPVGRVPLVLQLAVAIVVFDFVSFAVHVALHRYDGLWRLHKVHHSSLQLDGFATTRAHMFENMVRFVPAQAVLFLLGVRPGLVTPTVAIAAVYGISNHSNLGVDLHWAEGLFITPRLHRRHHVPETSQRNFGAILTVWDRLFGTLVQRDTRPDEAFGVPGEVDSYPQRFADALRAPLVQAR
jgi:sterol desaturase/sphingolipid hydroxylase (fatty acid hydroxylase superfamily)